MKKTNKCELCGKRYKLPASLKVEGTDRERICFTCEVTKDMFEQLEKVIEFQYGERYLNFLDKLVEWRKK
jgi:hypothetical protein